VNNQVVSLSTIPGRLTYCQKRAKNTISMSRDYEDFAKKELSKIICSEKLM